MLTLPQLGRNVTPGLCILGSMTKNCIPPTSFVRPHQPFDPPQTYFDLYRDKELRAPAQGDWVDPTLTEKYGFIKDSIFGCNDSESRRLAMAGYYACITHVDHQIGRILTALAETGDYNNTIVLFLADHGELLFDNNFYRKALPYEGSTHSQNYGISCLQS